MDTSEKTPAVRNCWQCANVPICKFADNIGEFGCAISCEAALRIVEMLASECKHFTSLQGE